VTAGERGDVTAGERGEGERALPPVCARSFAARARSSAAACPRVIAAASAIAARRSRSVTAASCSATAGGSGTGSGARRTSDRHAGRASGSTGPTWNRRLRTTMPRLRSCAAIVSASSDSSCAHVAVAARTWSTPRSSLVGRARRAILVPTASSQSRGDTGGASIVIGARASVERRMTAPICSGARKDERRAMRRMLVLPAPRAATVFEPAAVVAVPRGFA
jgi:hypothetical protein